MISLGVFQISIFKAGSDYKIIITVAGPAKIMSGLLIKIIMKGFLVKIIRMSLSSFPS